MIYFFNSYFICGLLQFFLLIEIITKRSSSIRMWYDFPSAKIIEAKWLVNFKRSDWL